MPQWAKEQQIQILGQSTEAKGLLPSSSHRSSHRSESTFSLKVKPYIQYNQTIHNMSIELNFMINILLKTILPIIIITYQCPSEYCRIPSTERKTSIGICHGGTFWNHQHAMHIQRAGG